MRHQSWCALKFVGGQIQGGGKGMKLINRNEMNASRVRQVIGKEYTLFEFTLHRITPGNAADKKPEPNPIIIRPISLNAVFWNRHFGRSPSPITRCCVITVGSVT